MRRLIMCGIFLKHTVSHNVGNNLQNFLVRSLGDKLEVKLIAYFSCFPVGPHSGLILTYSSKPFPRNRVGVPHMINKAFKGTIIHQPPPGAMQSLLAHTSTRSQLSARCLQIPHPPFSKVEKLLDYMHKRASRFYKLH